MARLLGLETEYGLGLDGADPGQMVAESRAVVCSYSGAYAAPWDYTHECPRRDMRGYEVPGLARNPDDARYDTCGPQYTSIAEEHADRVLPNGGRLYNDHGHPEFSTPECLSLRDLIAYDRAGAEVVLDCAMRRSAELGRRVSIYRNNTDYHGASYGTHECYLISRSTPVEVLISALGSFLATRQIFAGAGKAAFEDPSGCSPGFQLSQRADFITVEASVDTLFRRPLFNTRDEPHATAGSYARLHVICGDANMSEWAGALKVGSLALVLDAIEAGIPMPAPLRDPVRTVQEVSRDLTFGRRYARRGAPDATAIEVQRAYLETAARAPGDLAEREWVLKEWSQALDDLAEATQIGAGEFYQVMSEALQANYPVTAGLMPWVYKRPWPVVAIQLVDGFGHPTAPYYFLKRTYEPAHIQARLPHLLWTAGETVPMRAAVTYAEQAFSGPAAGRSACHPGRRCRMSNWARSGCQRTTPTGTSSSWRS